MNLPRFIVAYTVQRIDDGQTFNREYIVHARDRVKALTANLPLFTEDYPEEEFRYLGRIALDYSPITITGTEHLEP